MEMVNTTRRNLYDMGKNRKRKVIQPRMNKLELDDILNNFLDGNPNPDWKQFENWFGKDTLDMVKELYPEYFKENKSDESDADKDNPQKKKGGNCSGGANKDDQSSDQPDENKEAD